MLYSPDGQNYLKLRPTKAPVSWDTYTAADAEDFDYVGVLLTEPYVVVDVDNMGQAERLLALVQGEGVRTRVMQTSKGMHFWFKSATPVTRSAGFPNFLGIFTDFRCWGKQSQVCIRFQGQDREWLNDTPFDDVEELPKWLQVLKTCPYRFFEMGDGSGRNAALLAYQINLCKAGFTYDEAVYVLRLINTYIMRQPLPEDEFATVTRPEAWPGNKKSSGGLGVEPEEGERFHVRAAKNVLDEFSVIFFNDQLYIQEDGIYRPGEQKLRNYIVRTFPSTLDKDRSEVIKYIKDLTYVPDVPFDPYTICVRNGRFDLRTFTLREHRPEDIEFQRINATYDPTAYDPHVESVVRKVFKGDSQLIALFEELLGYTLIKNCRYHKAFLMTGSGSNGKSTIIKMIRNFLGQENVSMLSIKDLSTTFKVAELENRLANLGDDIDKTDLRETGVLKKLISGEGLNVERKYMAPFSLNNYAKLIFSMNEIPHSADKSDGFFRRLIIIPFDAKFTPRDPDFDPNIDDKVQTQNAANYMLNLAIRGARRLLRREAGRRMIHWLPDENKGFTRSDKVEEMLHRYEIGNSKVLTWIDDQGITEEDVVDKTTTEVYIKFQGYCRLNGDDDRYITNSRTFVTEIKKAFDLGNCERVKRDGVLVQVFKLKGDE